MKRHQGRRRCECKGQDQRRYHALRPHPLRRAVHALLTPHQEQVIHNLVQSGRYQNASEVMREGLRLLEQRVAEDTAKITALRQATSIGIVDLEHGRFTQVNEGDPDSL